MNVPDVRIVGMREKLTEARSRIEHLRYSRQQLDETIALMEAQYAEYERAGQPTSADDVANLEELRAMLGGYDNEIQQCAGLVVLFENMIAVRSALVQR